jgi:GNAT superfamily N-acetyltransferase
MASISIRPAAVTDTALILHFIKELAIYEKALDEVVASEADIRASLFDGVGPAHALICNVDGVDAGFAVYFYNYSTWQGRKGLYLEDLYVTPACRNVGAGKALLQHLARIAVSEGCGRFEWSVLDWNEPAIQFYLSLGSRPMHEWVRHRLTGDALLAFAHSDRTRAGA